MKCEICGNDNTRIIKSKFGVLCNKHYLQFYKHGKITHSIYEPNEFIIEGNIAKIKLCDSKGNITGYGLIDTEDVNKCKNIKWYKRVNRNLNYVYGSHEGKKVMLHRFVLEAEDGVVDHINHDGLDNRKSNLRIATKQENSRNSHKLNKVVGVNYDKTRSKWKANIMVDGKNIHLGRFEKFEDAVISRLEAEKIHFKEFAPQKYLYDKYIGQ